MVLYHLLGPLSSVCENLLCSGAVLINLRRPRLSISQVTVRGAGLGGSGGTCEDLLVDPVGTLLDAGAGRAGSGWGLPPDVCHGTGLLARHMRLLPGRDPALL